MSAGCPLRPGERKQNKIQFNTDKNYNLLLMDTVPISSYSRHRAVMLCYAVEVIKFDNDGGLRVTQLVQVEGRTLVTLSFGCTGQTHHTNVMQLTK